MQKNIQSLKKLLAGICKVDQQVTVTGVTNDSRSVKSGDLFIATVGDTVDARRFIPSAIERGAAAIVYEHSDGAAFSLSTELPTFPIRHLDQWQGEIASRFYQEPSRAMRCIGVTGTNGKTSCTQWIAQALKQYHIACGVMGTLGTGFPDTLMDTGYTTPDPVLLQAQLAALQQQGAIAVALEVSSHALAQHRLNGMQFDVAVFTQLSRDHLDYHGDMSQYAAAKKKLFAWEGLHAAVINIDDPIGAQWAKQFSKQYPVITYSLTNEAALIYANKIETQADGFVVSVKTPWGAGDFQLPFLGQFNISNALAVLGVLEHCDVPFKHALHCVELLQPVKGRMEMFGSGYQPAVIVDYSHTPDALKNALNALRPHCDGRLWCVFGCGGDRDPGKRPIMAEMAEQYSDQIIVTNDNPRSESPEQIVDDIMAGFSQRETVVTELDRAKAIDYAIQSADRNDTILIAGKGHEDYQIIGDKKRPFSDCEQVELALSRRTNTA